MDTKKLCYIGAVIGSAIGGYIPVLWGGDLISLSSLFFSLLGGIAGIWVGYRIGQSL